MATSTPTTRPTCGSFCTIDQNVDLIPFKSSTFCTNLNNGYSYELHLFRSSVEKQALQNFCGMTCGEISRAVCGSGDAGNAGDSIGGIDEGSAATPFEWTPLLFKSIYMDCCDNYEPSCSYCPTGTELVSPDAPATNPITTFNATCSEFVSYLSLEWWAHQSGETLDNYGPQSGNPSRSCNDIKQTGGPIWSPIYQWGYEPEWGNLSATCPCAEPAPSLYPSRSILPSPAPTMFPTMTSQPSSTKRPSITPSFGPSFNPTISTAPTARPTDKETCSAEPEETFRSIGALFTAFYVAGTYAFLFYYKSKKAGRPRFGMQEMISEVGGQFTATVTGVGIILICQNSEEYKYSSDDETGVIFSMTSLLAIDGFELLLTLMTIPFVGPDEHPGDTFDTARWNQLEGCTMYTIRFLIWCVGCGLPLVTFFMDGLFEESLAVSIPCSISLCLGMLVGCFGPCFFRKPHRPGGGTQFLWKAIKQLVGVIPGMIISIANKDWAALGWGAELFLELSHLAAEFFLGMG